MKFAIRDLLLVTVIVAIAVGWWVDRKSLVSRAEVEAQRLSEQAIAAQRRLDQEHKFFDGRLKAKSLFFSKSGKTLHLKWTPGASEPPDNWWLDESAFKATAA